MIAYINGSYRCYSTANGIRRHYLGCSHERPRQAIRHVHPDDYVSPLRAAGMGSPVTPDSSPEAVAEPTPAPRKRSATPDPSRP